MSNLPIFDVAGSALQAQSVRLSTIASNLANADSVAGSADAVYKPVEPVFQAQASAPGVTAPVLLEAALRGFPQLPAGMHVVPLPGPY